MRTIIIAILLILSSAAASAQHFPSDDDLMALIQSRVDEARAVGIVIGVMEADGTTRIVAYGDAGPDAQPLGEESVFEIGSITKVFTGILLADMAARGEVLLTDPVAKYLPAGVTMPSRGGRENYLAGLIHAVLRIAEAPDKFIAV